jgi:hypothetical protein
MKYLFSLLILISTSAWAEWTYVTSSASGDERFLNMQTIRKEGNIRKVWQLVNYSKPNEYGWNSQRGRIEIDCKNETVQLLSSNVFKEKFAGGNSVFETKKSDTDIPRDIAPNTVMWAIMEKVCSATVR